ncbi:MAG: preprotein translocase subunit SecG [Chitinophagaceae bacterium]|nr:MAG: preprotein translocase subunit SecG [Chitinophagaceae bacterium]
MTTLFLILIVLSAVILGFFVLVQNPKGGGLAGNVGGLSNQFMGVKQTTDVLEKGTWIFAALIAVLCLTSTFFIHAGSKETGLEGIGTGAVQQRPATTTPAPATPAK